MTNDLVAFLRARLDEDEAAARAVGFDRIEAVDYLWGTKHLLLQRDDGEQSKVTSELDSDLADHIARHDPARVLAEVEAKRAVVELASAIWEGASDGSWRGSEILAHLALPYADHPDYQPEWRP